jgi:2-oxoglutarate dehydrogenase E1 component
MSFEREFPGPNYGYILELYERYQKNPDVVDDATRRLFNQWKPTEVGESALQPGIDLSSSIGVVNLAQTIRSYGYLVAKLDPLNGHPASHPMLELEFHHLNQANLLGLPSELVGLPDEYRSENASQALETLRSIYCGAIGYDYGHIRNPDERSWLQQVAETGKFRAPKQAIDSKSLLDRLSQAEAFELFLNRIYPGKTRFSIEGLDMLVPMLDEIVGEAARASICAVLIGMPHRGRLNILAHILQKPHEQILAEFKDPKDRSRTWDDLGWTGDVKYHMGGLKSPQGADHIDLVVRMPANPSHLELIDPVLQGMSRAANSKVDIPGSPKIFKNASLSILIHGDASFVGQGVVAETLNLSQLPGYSTGGSLHIIANNQLGFTATEQESRSSLHASDLAKGFEIPIIHVNADEPEACIEAVHTAFAYRQEFHKDFVIDLIGYRRYGHNEGDEPRFTQPLMYREIDAHPSVRKLWASKLAKEGIVEQDEAERILQKYLNELQEINQKLDAERALQEPVPKPPPPGAAQKVDTSVSLERLKSLNQSLRQFPADFHLNPKLTKAVEKRRQILEDPGASSID